MLGGEGSSWDLIDRLEKLAPDTRILNHYGPTEAAVVATTHDPRLMARLGDVRRPAWKWSEKPGEVPAARAGLLTHDAARYADELWWRDARPELVMGPGSWGWVEGTYASMRLLERAGVLEAIDTPTVIVATTADKLVGYAAIARAAARLPRAELVTFGSEAAHEILREADPVRERALAAIDALLDRVAPPR